MTRKEAEELRIEMWGKAAEIINIHSICVDSRKQGDTAGGFPAPARQQTSLATEAGPEILDGSVPGPAEAAK